ncbi:BppU family phage baseplate upper protein [Enterococcus durans]|uniref:BppU family phage baseplate upper protein n=3 Tax=Enterococcus durans TaxID=53345 RepID=UPI00136EFC8E|nr:BppU family phage baseplate upper protein [Enterococcus durans]MZI10129.1 BppU family phage baseplate upper protein [Enterococcus durans]
MNRKTGEIVVPTEPVSRATKITGFTFKSYDKSTGVLQFQIKNQDGSPTDLIDATVRLFMYIYQGEEKKEFPIFDNQIITESYMQGIVKYPIPDMLLSYEGKVDANVYIDFPDGSHTDNLAFTFNIEKSIIDGDVQLNGEYYFKDFQQLLDGVKQEATEAVNAALTNVDSTIEKANQQINEFVEGATQAIDQTIDEVTEQLQDTQTKVEAVSKNVSSAQNDLTILEDRIDQTNQQIGDLGKLKKMYSNSIDFGDYDYSGNPNLSAKLNASSFSSGTGGTAVDDNDEIVFTLDGKSKLTKYKVGTQVPLIEGKQYTISGEIMLESDFIGDPSGLRLQQAYADGGVVTLATTTIPTLELNTWQKLSGSAIIKYASNTPKQWYTVFINAISGNPTGKVRLRKIKIEEGPTATPYQPNLLDAPYYLSKVALGENLIKPESQQPVTSSNYLIKTYNTKPMVEGKKYTITLEGTKPTTQVFRPFFTQATGSVWGFGDLKPVEGLTDIWSATFIASTDSHPTSPQVQIYQVPNTSVGQCTIKWLKLEEGDTRTPNISEYKYFGEGLKDSDNPNDYSWDVTPEYIEKGLNDSVSLTEPETILGLKNFAEGLQSSGVNVAGEYAKATDADKYTKHGAIYLGGCAWLAWETLTFQKTEGYAKGSYIRLGTDGNASFTYSDVPNIFGGYLWLGGVCQPDYTDGGFGSYHITVENNFDDARKPIVRFIDSPTTPVKKLAVRGFALVFAPAPTENSQVKE